MNSSEIKIKQKFPDFTVNLHLDDGTARIELISDVIDIDKYSFVFSLYQDYKRADEKRWVEGRSAELNYSGSGVFFVQIEYREKGTKNNKLLRTRVVSYLDKQEKESIDASLDAFPPVSCKIEYIQSRNPFHDFVLIQGIDNIDTSTLPHNMQKCVIGNLTSNSIDFYVSDISGAINDQNSFFSGFCIEGKPKEFIKGASDLSGSSVKSTDIDFSIGTYCLVRDVDGTISVTNDFFGSNKIYFYQKDGVALISNRYQLLVDFISAIPACVLEVDINKIQAMLSVGYHEMFSHNFSTHCLTKNVRQLYTGEYLVLDGSSVEVKYAESYAISEGSKGEEEKITEPEYAKLLEQAATEIKENVKAVLSSPHYKKIIVDLSGGMDSRVVYSAVTNFPEYKDKVKVRTIKNNYPLDHVIANQINSIYGYDYNTDDDIEYIERLSMEGCYSFIMEGKYFLPAFNYRTATGTMQLNGFFGEPCFRPRGTRSFLYGTYYEDACESAEDFAEHMLCLRGSPYMLVGFEETGCALDQLLKDEFSRIPGINLDQKIENHYLNYSHSYHASESFRPGFGRDTFSPIKSKSLFRLWRSMLGSLKHRKVGFDLIYSLNPLVSVIPFDSELANEDYQLSKDDLLVANDPVYSGAQVQPIGNLHVWEEANAKIVGGHPITLLYDKDSVLQDMDAAIGYMKKCEDHLPDVFNELKRYIYRHLMSKKDKHIEVNTLRNKLGVIEYHLSKMNP
ncbi:MAG: hypothetical protein Alpg2KO_08140 [Alphaproteobacteria bacterium]